MCYTVFVQKKYIQTDSAVSFIKYHIIFCSRFRRKIFNIEGVEERVIQLTEAECEKNGITILNLRCEEDHVYMCVSTSPNLGFRDVINIVKGATSRQIRDEFAPLNQMHSLWTKNYFISTEDKLSEETIRWYVTNQPKRS